MQKKITLNVISSGACFDLIGRIKVAFENKYHISISLFSGSSIGESKTSIPHRLERNEQFDIIVLADKELQILIQKNYLLSADCKKLVFSSIGAVVPYDITPPDLSTENSAIAALLNAKSIGYSASMSGTYLSNNIFPNLKNNTYSLIKDKLYKVVGSRVAEKVLDGTCDIGFQEMSEIIPFTKKEDNSTVQLVTPIPQEWQQINIFSVGIVKKSNFREESRQFIEYLLSDEIEKIIESEGLIPYTRKMIK